MYPRNCKVCTQRLECLTTYTPFPQPAIALLGSGSRELAVLRLQVGSMHPAAMPSGRGTSPAAHAQQASTLRVSEPGLASTWHGKRGTGPRRDKIEKAS